MAEQHHCGWKTQQFTRCGAGGARFACCFPSTGIDADSLPAMCSTIVWASLRLGEVPNVAFFSALNWPSPISSLLSAGHHFLPHAPSPHPQLQLSPSEQPSESSGRPGADHDVTSTQRGQSTIINFCLRDIAWDQRIRATCRSLGFPGASEHTYGLGTDLHFGLRDQQQQVLLNVVRQGVHDRERQRVPCGKTVRDGPRIVPVAHHNVVTAPRT